MADLKTSGQGFLSYHSTLHCYGTGASLRRASKGLKPLRGGEPKTAP